MAEDRHEIYDRLEKYILALPNQDELLLISGMAEGWDEAIAKVGLRNNIPYHVYIPNITYGAYYWGQKSLTGKHRVNAFDHLVENATEVTYVCGNVYVEGVHSNFIRNDAMVDAADSALVYKPTSSGTAHCVRLLKAKKVPFEVYPFVDKLPFTN